MLVGAALGLSLVAYGVFLTPTTRLLSIAAAATVLIAYAAVAWFVVPVVSGRYPAAMHAAEWAGLVAGTIFAAEICSEYVFLPRNNAPWGEVEFGLVFLVYASAGLWVAFMGFRIREAMIAGSFSAVVSSLVWCVFVLATFYLFYGTDRQRQVFQAEGDFDDFHRSGMSNFPAFITEDFFGATFYHLLLGPALGSVLGFIGGVIGQLPARIKSRRHALRKER